MTNSAGDLIVLNDGKVLWSKKSFTFFSIPFFKKNLYKSCLHLSHSCLTLIHSFTSFVLYSHTVETVQLLHTFYMHTSIQTFHIISYSYFKDLILLLLFIFSVNTKKEYDDKNLNLMSYARDYFGKFIMNLFPCEYKANLNFI